MSLEIKHWQLLLYISFLLHLQVVWLPVIVAFKSLFCSNLFTHIYKFSQKLLINFLLILGKILELLASSLSLSWCQLSEESTRNVVST
jgi:hypothetical protein